MKEITVVTGPMRSGTSCVTGLLERCGFDLGRNVRILRKKTRYNPMGHFEPDLLFVINERLLSESSKDMGSLLPPVPEQRSLSRVAAQRDKYFRLFIRKFDGELFKDPLMCLTLPYWEQHWPELKRAVFCLRHPLAVARSMENRYKVSVEQGLDLWHIYVSRFLNYQKQSSVFIFDFDAFIKEPVDLMESLLNWLGRPMDREEIGRHLNGFFSPEYVAFYYGHAELQHIPAHSRDLYLDVRTLKGPLASANKKISLCIGDTIPSNV